MLTNKQLEQGHEHEKQQEMKQHVYEHQDIDNYPDKTNVCILDRLFKNPSSMYGICMGIIKKLQQHYSITTQLGLCLMESHRRANDGNVIKISMLYMIASELFVSNVIRRQICKEMEPYFDEMLELLRIQNYFMKRSPYDSSNIAKYLAKYVLLPENIWCNRDTDKLHEIIECMHNKQHEQVYKTYWNI